METRLNPVRPLVEPRGLGDDDAPFEEWTLDEVDSAQDLLPGCERRSFDAAFD